MQVLVSAKTFSEMAKEHFFLAKVLAKVHVDMSIDLNLHCKYSICIYCVLYMFHFVKTIG